MKSSFLDRFLQTRRLLRTLDRLAQTHEQQVRLLARLADHFCPEVVAVSPEDLRAHSGVSYAEDLEQGTILRFVEKTVRDTGREPTEEEIIDYVEGRAV